MYPLNLLFLQIFVIIRYKVKINCFFGGEGKVNRVVYYTDGACSGNGRKDAVGGWAWVRIVDNMLVDSGQGSLNPTTNNIMELLAILKALENAIELGEERITIVSDSAYCINGATEWMYNWARNGWYRDKGQTKEVKNESMWRMLYGLVQQVEVKWIKVRGHSGNIWNEAVDEMAKNQVEERRWKIRQEGK